MLILGRVPRIRAGALGAVLLSTSAVLLAGASGGCTVLVNASSDQCSSDGDCAAFAGTFCSPDKVCVRKPSYCTSNVDCINAAGDDHHVCHKGATPGDNACMDLFSGGCSALYATRDEISDDNTILLGALSYGATDSFYGTAEASLDVARNELNSIGGLPAVTPGAGKRKIAILACSPSTGSPPTAQVVADASHLVKDVGVPLILGPTLPSSVADVVAQVAAPTKTLLLAPIGGGAPSLATDPARVGVLFRLLPGDDLDAKVRAWIPANYVDPQLRTAGKLAGDAPLRVVLLRESTAYGDAGAALMASQLTFNGKSTAENKGDGNYLEVPYGDPSQADFATTTAAAVQQVTSFAPHVIIAWGTSSSTTILPHLETPLESSWTAPIKPYWLLGPDAVSSAYVAYLTKNDDRRLRTIAVSPTPPFLWRNFQNFQSLFPTRKPSFPNPTFDGHTAAAYDSVYIGFYALAALRDKPITGANLGQVVGVVEDAPAGVVVQAGQLSVSPALGALQSGGHIYYTGASGPLVFNANGDATGYMSAMCVSVNGSTVHTGGFSQTGVYYDPNQKKVVGDVTCPPEQ